MFSDVFSAEALEDAWNIIRSQFLLSTWQTVYVTILSTLFAFIIGLPLGVLLVTGEEKGIKPLPKGFMQFLNVLINILRSIPFLILMIASYHNPA